MRQSTPRPPADQGGTAEPSYAALAATSVSFIFAERSGEIGTIVTGDLVDAWSIGAHLAEQGIDAAEAVAAVVAACDPNTPDLVLENIAAAARRGWVAFFAEGVAAAEGGAA